MKRKFIIRIIALSLICSAQHVKAQWTHSGTTTYLTNGGDNVGIGTTAPSYKLDIKDAANCNFRVQSTSTGSANLILARATDALNCLVNYKTGTTAKWYTGCYGNNDYRVLNASLATNFFISQSTGNVGIGTSSPSSKLDIQVNGTNSNSGINIRNTLAGGRVLGMNQGTVGALKFAEAGIYDLVTMDFNTRNVGIGTITPAHKLDVAGRMRVQTGNGTAGIWLMDGANSYDAAFWDMIDNNRMGFYGSVLGNWGMSIDVSNGNVGIGTTTPGNNRLQVYSTNNYAIWGETTQNGANGVSGICNVGGAAYGVYGESSTGWAGVFSGATFCSAGVWSGSDERLKENIQPFQNALDKVMKLDVKTYNFKSKYDRLNLAKGTQTGFIAQNLETVFPELVKTATDKSDPAAPFEFKAVNYTGMIPVLTAAMQEQQRKIESLEAALSQCCSNYSTQKNDAGNSAITSDKASLEQNAPNPFNDETTIHFYLPSNSTAVLKVMTLEGHQILAEQISKSGYGEVRISGSTMAAGTYTYTLIVNGKAVESKIMVLTK